MSERLTPMTADTFRKIVARAGELAKIGMPIHPHMLRHSTGFKLANDGRDTRSIQHYLDRITQLPGWSELEQNKGRVAHTLQTFKAKQLLR